MVVSPGLSVTFEHIRLWGDCSPKFRWPSASGARPLLFNGDEASPNKIGADTLQLTCAPFPEDGVNVDASQTVGIRLTQPLEERIGFRVAEPGAENVAGALESVPPEFDSG